MLHDHNTSGYTDDYKESVFQLWLELGQPSFRVLRENVKPDVQGRIPHEDHLNRWSHQYKWYERRDEIQGKAALVVENKLVEKTVEMWGRHADNAQKVIDIAITHILENGFDTSASAVAALKWAQDEERRTRGAEALIENIKSSDNETIIEKIRKLAERRASTDDVIDAETPE